MKPKKEILERLIKSGVMGRLNELLSVAHMLQCVASNLHGEAEDLMREYGLHLGDIKRAHSAHVRASDNYFKLFASLITTKKSTNDLFADIEAYERGFREWAKIPQGWQPGITNETEE